MNKKYFFSHRVTAMLLTLALCLGMIPTASAAQQNSYHDPVEHWQQASNRTNELDVNAIVTHETFYCATCRENTDFTVWRVPEYTRSGETALNRNVKYSNGMCIDEVTVGSLDAGTPITPVTTGPNPYAAAVETGTVTRPTAPPTHGIRISTFCMTAPPNFIWICRRQLLMNM